jgi:hypothetical protein
VAIIGECNTMTTITIALSSPITYWVDKARGPLSRDEFVYHMLTPHALEWIEGEIDRWERELDEWQRTHPGAQFPLRGGWRAPA